MTIITVQSDNPESEERGSFWSHLSLVRLSIIILAIGATWRIIDVLVLGLGNTWLNPLPSKLFPLLIMFFIFHTYRKNELESTLGISRNQLKSQLFMGLLIGFILSVGIDIGGTLVYTIFIDPSYPLLVHSPLLSLLVYNLFFFFVNAVFEESLFRGLLQNGFKTQYSPVRAILFSAVIFGVWHAVWPLVNWTAAEDILTQTLIIVFSTTLLGIFFGIYYEKFSSGQTLTGPIITHTIINFVNESFKIGPEPAIQGPDILFANSVILMISFTLFFILFPILIIVSWKYRVEDVEAFWHRVVGRFISPLPKGTHIGKDIVLESN